MKNKIIFLILLTFIVITPNFVSALNKSDVEVECVYENGIVITAYGEVDKYGISSSTIKLSNQLTPPYNSSSTYFYNEKNFSERILSDMTCPGEIGYFVVEQTDDEDGSITFQVYYHLNDEKKVQCCKDDNSEYDENYFKGQIIPGFNATGGSKVAFSIAEDSPLYNRSRFSLTSDSSKKTAFAFRLVGERIYINSDEKPTKQWAFKSEGEQAASNPTYIRVYEYTAPNGTTIKLAENKDSLSKLEDVSISTHDDSKTIFACFKPSIKEIDTSKTDMAYKFSNVRHSLSVEKTLENSEVQPGTNDVTCDEGYSLYREVNWDEAAEEEEGGTSICDVIPETALLIAKIINYTRILVPAFLIILTAIDITRIVLTGDIEEELPKRRKLIITRFIIAMVFFFLPIFVQIFISSSYGIDFGDISCLW